MPDAPQDYLHLIPGESTLPPELHGSVRRHHRHLSALIISLRAAGVDETIVKMSVWQLTESYRVELTAAMQAIVQGKPHA